MRSWVMCDMCIFNFVKFLQNFFKKNSSTLHSHYQNMRVHVIPLSILVLDVVTSASFCQYDRRK